MIDEIPVNLLTRETLFAVGHATVHPTDRASLHPDAQVLLDILLELQPNLMDEGLTGHAVLTGGSHRWAEHLNLFSATMTPGHHWRWSACILQILRNHLPPTPGMDTP